MINSSYLLLLTALIALIGAYWVRRKTLAMNNLYSMPIYHFLYFFLTVFLPILLFLFLFLLFERTYLAHFLNDLVGLIVDKSNPIIIKSNIINHLNNPNFIISDRYLSAVKQYQDKQNQLLIIENIGVLLLLIGFGLKGLLSVKNDFPARQKVEFYLKGLMFFCTSIAVLTTFGILFSLVFESLHFFKLVPIKDFLFNLKWDPQQSLNQGQLVRESFGILPLLAGTLLISAIALLVAVPIGLLSAVYLSEYASVKLRSWAKPMLEVLAGIPTVVYGFFAAITVAPFIRSAGDALNIPVASQSALAAGLVMGIMIIPFISSLSDDVISAVPHSLREGSYGLGANKSETVKKVVLPAALPGIVSAVLLAASRAIGETMIVVMAAGLSAKLTFNPLESVTTMTVQIVTVLTGDTEFDSAKTLSAFALGLTLFVITFLLNLYALYIVKKYREQYE